MPDQPFAPFWSRLLANNIDLTLFLGVGYGMSIFLESDLILYSALTLIYILYHTVMELSVWKGSIGKKLLNIQVVSLHDGELTFWRSLVRNSLKLLSLAVLFGGFLMIRFNMKNQGLHDWLSGTVVILT